MERMVENMEIKGMNGATKFVDWLLEMGYLDKEDIATDGVDIAMDMNKVKEVAPKFYNMLMCMCDCEERAQEREVDIMVTDGILGAVQMIIDRFKTSDEIYAGKIIWDMLSDYDEDEWYSMSDEQKKEWIIKYIERR